MSLIIPRRAGMTLLLDKKGMKLVERPDSKLQRIILVLAIVLNMLILDTSTAAADSFIHEKPESEALLHSKALSPQAIKVNYSSFTARDTICPKCKKREWQFTYPENKTQGLSPYVLGGMGLGISIEYEKRLSGYYRGFGLRGGIGLAALDASYATVPLQLNYLLGNEGSYFEMGTGVTWLHNNGYHKTPNCFVDGMQLPGDRSFWFINTVTVGYRGVWEIRANSPCVFRIGLTPCFGYNQVTLLPFIDLDYPF